MTAACQIIQIDSDTNAWDEFVQSKSNASIYHLSVWKKLIKQHFWPFILLSAGDV